MGNFRQNDRTRSGDRDGGRFDMHKAVCGECGANCEVPFRPTGERPVLCSDCFKKQGGGGSRSSRDSGRSSRDSGRSSRFGDNRRERSSSRDRQSFDVVCDKCEKDCQVPFKPTAGKPIFCDNCFRQEGGGSKGSRSKDSGEVMEQLKQLNIKIDELMKILTPKPKIKKIEAVKEVTKTKPKTKTTKSKK